MTLTSDDTLRGNRTETGVLVPLPDSAEVELTAEEVAKVVIGISEIGRARAALEKAGWSATIAGNRISVNGKVFAQFIAAVMGQFGRVEATWMVYTMTRSRPVWIVGAEERK